MTAYSAAANAIPLPFFGAELPGRSPYRVHADSTRQPVRWTRIDRRSATKIFHQARALDRRSHVAGKHGGRIGHTGILVLECLIFDHLNWRTGQLDPSYEAIAAKANLARSTVGAALRRLKELGVLNWLRRCEETMEGGRYVLRQISNAYAVLPPSLWRAVGLLPAKAPPPAPGTWGDHPPLPDVVGQAAEAASGGAGEGDLLRLLDLDRKDRLAAALLKLGSAVVHRAKS
jgi:hypothetical protein